MSCKGPTKGSRAGLPWVIAVAGGRTRFIRGRVRQKGNGFWRSIGSAFFLGEGTFLLPWASLGQPKSLALGEEKLLVVGSLEGSNGSKLLGKYSRKRSKLSSRRETRSHRAQAKAGHLLTASLGPNPCFGSGGWKSQVNRHEEHVAGKSFQGRANVVPRNPENHLLRPKGLGFRDAYRSYRLIRFFQRLP
ncbi:hypothetical protein MPNT_30072 [Candidatus Methylacidithermus pantelleriae]|uniref:Uncharacterized protein n=1 Tax=Candidatus Methylacidithermus pantelleriae TaxID=2744239 RepID=A0A8J2FQJ8_9BACT|nr:hypothetical protein MPNT_30072 [Candidatus Methylacidithermus pantelleriae]